MTNNHFKKAESFLRTAEIQFEAFKDAGYPEGDTRLNEAHYYLQFANAHTVLAQVQAQTTVFGSVDKMADAMTVENKENN